MRSIFVLAAGLASCSGSDLPTAALDLNAAARHETGQPNLITLSPAAAALVPGQTLQLAAAVTNKHGVPQPDRPIAFASGDAGVATVSPAGLVTAVAPGRVTIVASTGGAKPLAAGTTISVGPGVALTMTPFAQGRTTSGGSAVATVVGDYPQVELVCALNGVATACDQPLRWSSLGLGSGDLLTLEVTARALDVSPPAAGPTTRIEAVIDDLAPTIFDFSMSPAIGVTTGGPGGTRFVFRSDDPDAWFSCRYFDIDLPCEPNDEFSVVPVHGSGQELVITGIDAVGNVSVQRFIFNVDVQGPVWDPNGLIVPGDTVGPASTPSTEIHFFADDQSRPVTYLCSLDGGPQGPCSDLGPTQGVFQWSGLSDGWHTLTAVALDWFGNASVALNATFLVADGH